MRVVAVEPGSEAEERGVRPEDDLVAIDGRAVRDAIDLAFALGTLDGETARVAFVRSGKRYEIALAGATPGESGIELAPDAVRTCGNRCLFCFVDQLPPGLRPSLYVKDEDYRLSFAYGNYVTLTNLAEDDYRRIERQRLSPLYVSVHATRDDVRREMLGNPEAPAIMQALERLARAGIRLHAQIVVCPGRNDGEVLEQTLEDLASLGEATASIAVVPVGLTSHRAGLPAIRPVSPTDAGALVDTVARWQARFRRERGSAVVFAADELHLLAGRGLPPHEHYEDFPQLENGVGLLRRFEHAFLASARALTDAPPGPMRVTLVTSTLPAAFLREVCVPALAAAGIELDVLAVENTLLGPTVTVAGLLGGPDMARALAGAAPSDLTLLPGEAFTEDGLTIDGMTVETIARETGRENVIASTDIVGAILEHAGRDGEETRRG